MRNATMLHPLLFLPRSPLPSSTHVPTIRSQALLLTKKKKSSSLPSSPKKDALGSNRSIEDLRAAIVQMKASSSSSHLQRADYKVLQGMPNSTFCLPGSAKAERLKMVHHSPPELHALEHSLYYPDKENFWGQYSNQVNPTQSAFQPTLPSPNVPFVQPFKPLDNAQASPPKLRNSNPLLVETSDPFPPLGKPCQTQNVQNNQGTSSSPSSPRAPWSQLFNSNRIKTNGTSLENLPTPNMGDNPSIEISHEEVFPELDRWRNALVGHVIGAKPPFKLMQQFVERSPRQATTLLSVGISAWGVSSQVFGCASHFNKAKI